MGFKKLLHGIIIKTIESAVQKLGIADHIVKQFLWFTGIGNIAPTLACNINFLTQLFIFFKEGDPVAFSGCCQRRHHPRGSSAHYQNPAHDLLPSAASAACFFIIYLLPEGESVFPSTLLFLRQGRIRLTAAAFYGRHGENGIFIYKINFIIDINLIIIPCAFQ